MESVESLAARLRTSFGGRVLVLGYGGVAQCTLPLLLRHIDMPRDRITVMDFVDCRHSPLLKQALAAGVKFVQEKIERATMGRQFEKYLGQGDLLIDLAWNIECTDILSWCHDHGVLYVNTSVELWDPYEDIAHKRSTDRTLYVRHMAIRALMKTWKEPGPTAVLEHGANPGLVSHFTKRALIDMANKLTQEKPKDARIGAIQQAKQSGAFNSLAQLLGVKVIHISEIDTQVSSQPHDPNVFTNTWSVEGFYEEGTAPAEMGWGTHERILPPEARCHVSGPRNQICMARFGINTFVRSRVPSGETVGMVVRHGEAFTISDYLTVLGADGTPVYRPTVHYAYLPAAAAVSSLHTLRARNYKMQEKIRIMGDDIKSGGVDELGVLLMGHDFKSWWTGTILSIDDARRLVPGMNATTMQVAASVLGAVFWMIKNPKRGVLVPDQLPHEEILSVASPYLGEIPSAAIDWMPGTDAASVKVDASFAPADDDPWQFHHFLLEKPTEVTGIPGWRNAAVNLNA